MSTVHQLIGTAHPGGLLFACEDETCGRRLVIDRDSGEMVIIDHGDRLVPHQGAMGGVRMRTPGISSA